MDLWARWGLLAGWTMFALAMLWWWRRRHNAQRYPYAERATVIHDALRQSADLGLIYWSRSERRFLRRVVTPLELNGHSLKAFDHQVNDVRIFKVTRIKTIQVVQRGSKVAPSLLRVTASAWALAGLGVGLLALLAVALFRGSNAHQESAAVPAVLPAAAAAVTSNVAGDVQPTVEWWGVVVENAATYDTNRVVSIIQRRILCTAPEAEEFVRQIRSLGRATVWRGKWTNAERLRQALESDDLIAHLERVPAR